MLRRGQRRGRLGLGVAALLSALWFGMAADWFRGSGRVPVFANLRGTGSKPDDYPSVSIVETLARGGIEWRGTFYPLETLRRGP